VTTPAGERTTRQRTAIVETMDALPDFRSARQIHALLEVRGHRIGLATVYRTLHAMAERGECDVLRPDDGESAVYRRCTRRAHHHHLVCRSCGSAVEVEGPQVEAWAADLAGRAGYTEVTHSVELFGTCGRCRRRQVAGGPDEAAPARTR
jgi:Fur family ferric uptake transcriptional regulator